jgi:hypothetical protein
METEQRAGVVMLLDYHSLYGEPEPQKRAPAWVPQPIRRPKKQVVALTSDAALPALEASAVVRTRTRATALVKLLALVLSGVLDADNHGGWTDELLLMAGAVFLLDIDEDDDDDDDR